MKKQTKDILNALPITGQKLIHDAYIEIESKLRNAGIISLADKMTAYKTNSYIIIGILTFIAITLFLRLPTL